MHMERVTSKPFAKVPSRLVVALLVLLGVTSFQMLGLPQPITGPVVNALLFATALWLGPWTAVGVGALTPVVAYGRGILAAPLGPMIPFIAVANALMVVVFHASYKQGRHALAVAAASVAKFALLATAVRLLVEVPQPVAMMMQWPQLMTALAGGYLAVALHRWRRIPRSKKII